MANYRAIAGASATLRNLLEDRMENPVSVTIAPPDVSVTGMTGSRVNLYLYQVEENGYLKNQELPGQGHPAAYGHPPLSLDLHYLVTAFGSNEVLPDADLDAQQILGDVMRVFHDYPVVTEALHENDNPADPLILDVSLVGEQESLKITLEPDGLDHLSSLWGALPENSFRRSVSYHCSVVQIQSQQERRSASPVRERRVYALTLSTPHVDEIVREPPFDGVRSPVAEVGDTIVLLGRNLRSESVSVRIGDELTSIPDAQARRIQMTVPTTLQAGTHPVQVVQDLMLVGVPGDPLVPHRGFASNVLPFLVIPDLQNLNPPTAPAGATVTVTVSPAVGPLQERVLLLGDVAIPGEPVAFDSAPSTTVDFRLPTGASALPAGTYLARIRVDGAESRLTFNASTLEYDGPTLAVT